MNQDDQTIKTGNNINEQEENKSDITYKDMEEETTETQSSA